MHPPATTVTEETVKFHLSNIYRKLDVANRTEASRWAQVNGLRGQTSIADRVEWDNHYIRNWSLWFDLRILTLTVFEILRFRESNVVSAVAQDQPAPLPVADRQP